MRILLSNDDGYFAPGIEILAKALAGLGQVTVVAPERDRSGASNSLTLDRPLIVRKSANGFMFVNGTPTDCVHLAVTGLLEELPDMVISGINLGAAGSAQDAGPGTDFHAVAADCVSLTPLQMDLTHREQILMLRGWIGSA